MQTLGISNAEPASENRLKNLFWPTIRTGMDVDTLGAQGYWICAIVAALTLVMAMFTGHPFLGLFYFAFYYFGGVGVRQHSCYSALIVFLMYLLDTIFSFGALRIFICLILLANLRATFIASFWEPQAVEAEMPARFNDTWSDKFVDQFPQWVWPKIRIPYYIFSAGPFALVAFAIAYFYAVRFGLISPEMLRRFVHH